MMRTNRGLKKFEQEEEEEQEEFDLDLSVCSLQDLSERGYIKLRFWMFNLLSKKVNLANMPSFKDLKRYKNNNLLPDGLESDSKTAHITPSHQHTITPTQLAIPIWLTFCFEEF